MRLLQTGDLHLGKMFHEHPLIDDQKHILQLIMDELQSGEENCIPYDILLLCGDIYDRSVPPPDAVALFGSFLTELHNRFPGLVIIIIAGNHDSPRRLGFASELLSAQHIHIAAGRTPAGNPVIVRNELLDGSCEKLAVYQMPFLVPSSFDEAISSQEQMVRKTISEICSFHSAAHAGAPALLCAHLFTQNGTPSDSERILIGNAEKVPPDLFTPFAYTALGHLHTCQQQGERVWYAGSPLAYSFGESSQKYLLSITIDSNADISQDFPQPPVSVKKIPLKPLHRVIRLEGTFQDIYADPLFDQYRDDYVEIRYTDSAFIEKPLSLMRTRFPLLLSVQQKADTVRDSPAVSARKNTIEKQRGAPDEGLFRHFIEDAYAGVPSESRADIQKECRLFVETAKEIYASFSEE